MNSYKIQKSKYEVVKNFIEPLIGATIIILTYYSYKSFSVFIILTVFILWGVYFSLKKGLFSPCEIECSFPFIEIEKFLSKVEKKNAAVSIINL